MSEKIEWEEVYKIGIVGWSGQQEKVKNNLEEIKKTLKSEFTRIERENEGRKFAVVSGLTNIGVPKVAYEIGKAMSFLTVGIACSRAKNFECFDVSKKFIIGSRWGDESQFFLDYIDILIRIGGGPQSQKEVKMARVLEIPIREYDFDEN